MSSANGPEYPLDNDAEAKRLSDQHDVLVAAAGGRLLFAPVDLSKPDLQVLDSGTADGRWLFDLQKSISSPTTAKLIGTDIKSERFTENTPTGLSFQIQNINDPWPEEWRGHFDFVHQRLVLAGAGSQADEVTKRLLELVKPGGWVELVEAEQVVGEHDGPALNQFLEVIKEMFTVMGSDIEFSSKLESWLKNAGFVNVETRSVDYHLGSQVNDPALRQKGLDSICTALTSLLEYGKRMPNGLKCMSREEMDTAIPRLRAELERQGGNYPIRFAWGQKPL